MKKYLFTILTAVIFGIIPRVPAATLTVTKTGDTNDGICDTDCGLREAIAAASSGDTIDIPAGVYTLTSASQLVIDKNLTLNGEGANTTIIQAADSSATAKSRVILVNSGVNANIAGVTIRHGSGNNRNGAGIRNAGTLNLTESAVRDNSGSFAAGGPDIFDGAGIYNEGMLTLTRSLVTNNRGRNGAIHNTGTAHIMSSTISQNTASNINGFGTGGGIYNSGSLTAVNSTISGNTSIASGGGIYNSGPLTMINSTISGNTAKASGGGVELDRTLYGSNATAIFLNCTITGNAAKEGGGIASYSRSVQVTNTIIAGNAAPTGPDCFGNLIISHGHNLIGDTSGCSTVAASGDLFGTALIPIDPLLDPLEDNSGLNVTHALRPCSPAIDAGDDSQAPAVDQRDANRPVDGDGDGVAISDIGAYEFDPSQGDNPRLALDQRLVIKSAMPTVIQLTRCALGAEGGVSFIVTALPSNGRLYDGATQLSSVPYVLSSDVVTYTPDTAFFGPDNFGFRFSNGTTESNTAAINVTVVSPGGITITVNKTGDTDDGICSSTDCSLREAVELAGDGDIIAVPAGTYSLSLGRTLTIDKNLTLVGNSANNTIIQGFVNPPEPDIPLGTVELYVFDVAAGNVSIAQITIQHGAASSISDGGGVRNQGTLALSHCVLRANTGAIYNTGVLTITNSVVRDSHEAGIWNEGAVVTILGSSVVGNSGPGVYNEGTLNLANSAISSNGGGGIYNKFSTGIVNATGVVIDANDSVGIYNYTGTVIFTNSTISNNTGVEGGGIENRGDLILINCTVSGNSAVEVGGGILNTGKDGGAAILGNVTVTNNTAAQAGGIYHTTNELALINTIVAGNFAAETSPDCNAFTSLGHNLIGDTSGCDFTPAAGDLLNVDPKISPLMYNGGATFTHLLLANSPAINAGDNGAAPPTDQRGIVRPQGTRSDIGAYEFQPGVNMIPGAFDTSVATLGPEPISIVLDGFDGDAGSGLQFVIVSLPGNGQLIEVPNSAGAEVISVPHVFDSNTVTYVPQAGFHGIDKFTFKAFDGEAESNPATATIDVRHLLIVTKTADSNDGICDADCSVREAIAAIASGGTIDIPTGIYTLTLGTQLTINKDLTLTGGGADSTIIQAAAQPGLAAARVLGIDSGNDVAIAGMTVRHGLGGISNRGTLTLSEVVIRDNNGGGIENAGTLTVTDSTVSGNSTSGSGGAILNSVGILKLNNCTVTGNTAREGGGIANTNNGAKLIITGSTISGNSAVADGGGIWNSNGTVSLTNVTITNNQTSANGGGIYQTGTLTVTNSTLAHNTAADAGGGIFHESGTTTLFNSIIAHNHADNGSPDCNRFTSHGHNLIGDTSGCIFDTAVGDLVNVDPMLGPLQYAGGPTLVHVLLFGSPAIDAGANSNALATDQRGVARPQNAHSDIGAYEFQPGVNTLPAAFERMIRFPQETSAVITLTGFDADIGNTLRYIITSLPENGHLFEGDSITGEMISSVPRALAADKVTYKANEGNVNNNDRFTFKVNDGEADSNIAIITLDIVRTLTVTKTNDTNDGVCDADCSLREAITAATPGDVINVPIGIYTLTVGSEFTIDKDLTLTGAGPANTIIEAATQPDIANFRVFNVTSGSVVISGVTIRHGRSGIQNSGTLSLTNSIIEGNSAGGVVNYGGTLTIDNSKVTGNKTVSEGGGVYIAGGAVTITTTTINDNSAVYGAGVSLSNGKLTLINSTISGNSAVQGGGIDAGGTLSLINCTISGNRTISSGSGIRNFGILALANCTIAANTSNSDGRGLNHRGGGTATLINTVIAGNIPAGDCYGEITSLGHNLIGDASDCDVTPAVGDLIDVDARLGPLQNAGGPTKTHVLLPGSPAIDAGYDNGAPATDQRGVVRPQGEHVDIGAYESQPVNTLPAAFDDIIITPEDTPVVIILEGFDAETSNVLTFIIASLPENGTLFDGADVTGDMITSTQYVLAGDTVTYRPQEGYGNSDESFTFTVNDGEQDSSPATITVDIRHTIPVTKTADTNDGVCNQDCSLREAVAAAKSGDRISIPAGVYTLTLGSEFRISRDLTVVGAGAENTFIEAAAKSDAANWRVFNVTGGNVEIQDVTIRNGADSGGGGILNGSTLTLINSVVTGNTAVMPVIGGGGHGGGIYNDHGTLTVINTVISSNSAASGGGIYNYSSDVGTITVTDSAVSANTASYGGGIYNASGEATVTSSIISGNRAVNGGGGIYNHGWLTLDNSSISGNTGSSGGGLLFNAGKLALTNSIISYNLADSGGGLVINNGIGGVTLTDSVISGNYATQNGGGIHNTGRRGFTMINGAVSNNSAAFGGGLYTRGDVVLTNSTVNGNIASEWGGIRKAGGNLILRSTIVAGNTATRGPDCGGVTFLGSVGYNLIEDPSDCNFSPAASDLVNVIPLLTVDGHLRIQSPAIDAATGVEAPDGDRDHEGRPDGVNVDIGADEYVDSDEDGLPDWLEQQVVGDDASLDPGLDYDHDGLKNIEEYELSANPANPDTDLDGTWDGEEVVRNSEQHELNRISDPREPDTLLAPFNALSQFATADPPVSQVVLHSVLADVDADDDIDLICARATGQLVYFENSGSAVSPHWESYNVIGTCPRHLAVGDMDGDSDLDVMILTARNLIFIRNEYQEGQETTTWALPEAIDITIDNTLGSRAYLADVVNKLGAPEKDGLSDIVIVAFDGRMTLIRNNGSTGGARWQSPDPDWAGTTVFSPTFKTLGDIDLDGDLDRFVGLDANDKPVFQKNIDDHLLMFPRTVTIAQGDEQIIEVTVDDDSAADMTALHMTIAQNTSNGTIAPVGGHAWRYVAGTTGVGVDVIKGTLERNDGSRLSGLVVVNVISKAEADLVGKALIVVGKRSDNDPLYSISERLAVYAYVVCRQQGYATENIRLLTPDGKLSSGDVRIGSTAHLGWNVAVFGENSLLESIIKGPWAGSADDLLLYFVDHGVVDAGVGQLLLSPSFRVSSTELNQWLNLWQTVDKKATVIIDTCYSGRFVSELQSPPHPDRIILAAAQPGQLAHFQAGGVISFSQFFWDELSAGATLGSAYLQARNGLENLRQLPTLDFTDDGIADDEQVTQTESIRQFGNPALLSGVQRPLIRNVMNDTTAESGLATLWVNESEINSNHGVERVFAYLAPPTLETDVDNGSAIVGMDHVELTDFIARRHIDDADFDYWQTLPGQPDPDDPTQLFLSPEDKALLSASYVNASDGHYALRPNVNVANKQNLRRIEERLGYPPRYEADWTEFDISGDYQIVFFVQDRWGMLSPAKVAMVTVAGPISKAIVVECAGTTGVASPGDPARIHSHGSLVERNLRLRSFTSDTIRWFGANHLPPQKSEIGSSITAWAQDAVHLTLYFVGNAASAGLVLENNDIIAPLEIKAWLDQFQATSGGNVTVIIDANFAGQFATALAGSGDTRQVICSTGKASQNLRHAGADFTRWLWNGLARDASIQQAFADTLAFARAAGIDPPFILDDNGDGIYTPKQDGIVSRALFIGQSLPTGEGELTIGAVNEALVVEAGGTARLWAAEILVPDGSTPTVWAELLPPGYAVGDPVARIDLSLNPVTNRYEGEHQFLAGVAAGRHVALIQVVSSANLDHTSLPAPVEIYYQIPIPPGTRTAPIDIPRIVPGAAMQATTLSENPDENWFRLWAAKGKRFTIDLVPGTDSAAADLVLRICDRPDVDALSVIEADDWGAGFAERIWNWQPADTGWYYVHVEEYDAGAGSRTGAGSYILHVTQEQSAGADGYEVDDVSELAHFMSMHDGEFQSHNFHQAGDEDWIAFRLLQGYSYTIKVYDWGVNSEPILEWYDGDELADPIRCITTSSASAEAAADCERAHTANREINLDTGLISKTGTYYVKVRNAASAFGLGADYKIMNFDTVGPQVPADIFGLLKIKDDPQNRLIPGMVTIDIFDGAHTERTWWCCGEYTTTLAPQTTDYTLTAMADGYQSQAKTVHVSSGAEIALDFELTPLSTIAHTITVAAENGRVDNLHNPYSPGSEALLIPSPDIHHEFSHWSGVAINSGNATAAPLRFTITDHVSLTAHFAPKQYSLEIENSAACENCGTPLPSGQYDPGHLAAWSVVTPWPSEAGENGVRFVAEIPSGNALMDRDRVITLDWIRQYYLTVQTQGQGTVSKTSGWRNADEVVRINAVGQGTHRFANWLADGKAVAGNPLNVAMDRAKEIAAEFIPVTSLDIDGNGGVGVPTDGILIMRYLFGFTSPALTDGIVGPGGGRSDSEILVYLVSARANGVFDIDGNGREDALTDGVMILRHLAGEGAGSVSNSAVDSSNCVRCDGTVIKQFMNAFTP